LTAGLPKYARLFVQSEAEIEAWDSRSESNQISQQRKDADDWLAMGDCVAAGERWAFALMVLQPLLKLGEAKTSA